VPRAGSENRRHARLDLKLLEQPVEMHLDRLLPDPEHGGELLVAVPAREKGQKLAGGGRTGIGLALDSISLRMYHGFPEIVKGLEKNGFFGLLGSLPMAVLALLLFFLEGELPLAVLLGGALERALRHGVAAAPAFFTFREIILSFLVVALTLLVRGVLDLRLRLGLLSTCLHPLWVACLTWIFARSTFINGVLHRNEWRGRVRDARSLRT
jgi:hypothetical protein